MNTVAAISFIHEYIYLYTWYIFTTFLNIIATTSGSMVINPVVAYFTNPVRAIGMSAFIFFLSGVHRVWMFRKNILDDALNVKIITSMLPASLIGALCGGLFLSYVNIHYFVVLIVCVSTFYIGKNIYALIYKTHTKNKLFKKRDGILVALFAGFAQGAGLPGVDIRNGYIRQYIKEVSVRAVGSCIGLFVFFIAGSVVLYNNKLLKSDLIFIVTVFPFLIAAQVYGKLFLEKISDRKAKMLAILFSSLGVSLLAYKYLL